MKLAKVVKNNKTMLGVVFRFVPLFAWLSVIVTVLIAADNVVCNSLLVNYLYNALAQKVPVREVLWVLSAVGVLLVTRYLLRAILEESIKPKARIILYDKLQTRLYEKAVKMDLSCYDNPDFYNDFVFAVSEAETRAFELFETVMRLASCVLMFGGYVGVMLELDPVVMIPAALYFAVSFAVNSKRVKINYSRTAELKPEERRRDYAARVFYLPEYAKELRMTNIREPVFHGFTQAICKIKAICVRHGKKLALLSVADELLCEAVLLNGGVYAYLVYALSISKSITVGGFMSLAFTVENVIWRMNDIISSVPQFAQHALYIENFIRFLDYEPEIKSGSKPVPVNGNIELRHVTFGYDASNPIIKDVNLTIRQGEKIAIVGFNGAGKTTLVKLLLRLYDISDGEILLGGINIKELDLKEYRKYCGTTFQDFQIFAAKLCENVAMEKVERTDKQIEASLIKSGFTDRLQSLPLGVHTPLTREFDESGVNLSGGEAQKVAISRCFYRDCPFVILDEPSAALDPISEYNLNHALVEMAADKTVLFISHRLSTATIADRIYVLDHGQISESGSHRELLAQGGKYAEMWNAQAGKYQMA